MRNSQKLIQQLKDSGVYGCMSCVKNQTCKLSVHNVISYEEECEEYEYDSVMNITPEDFYNFEKNKIRLSDEEVPSEEELHILTYPYSKKTRQIFLERLEKIKTLLHDVERFSSTLFEDPVDFYLYRGFEEVVDDRIKVLTWFLGPQQNKDKKCSQKKVKKTSKPSQKPLRKT